ncbi:hypothetical protein ACFRMN_17920 [Streptomyces sp. NPDC056835]|uniref:hypothetical protein n=1 Tax=Streptomyces sp. NPDC056835 TaxID=3345956 RepID=UPI0036807BEC
MKATIPGETQPGATDHTPKALNPLKASAAVAAIVLAAASCTTESPAPAASNSCEHAPASTEAKLVSQLLGTDEYKTGYRDDSGLSEKLTDELRQWKPGGTEYTTDVCRFSPKVPRTSGGNTLRVEFYWTSRSNPSKWGRTSGSYYNFNGITGESDETLGKLRVPCSLPGELNGLSKQTLLGADVSNTAYEGPEVNQQARDQQILFLYLMTRKATEALGCENNPLKADPIVKAYTTPEKAAQAGS